MFNEEKAISIKLSSKMQSKNTGKNLSDQEAAHQRQDKGKVRNKSRLKVEPEILN